MFKHVIGIAAACIIALPVIPGASEAGQKPDGRPTRTDQNRQRPQGPQRWWRDPKIKAELALTEAQAAEIERIFQARIPEARRQWRALDGEQKELDRLIKDGNVDEATIAAQIDRVESRRSEANKGRTLMLYRIHVVLTPEQRVKLNALQEHGRSPDKKPDK
jgi:Spy/CpxP family protein refolding chaperone